MTVPLDNLACKVPLIVGALLVLLAINTVLQYAAGPALQHALPLQEARNAVRIDAHSKQSQQAPRHTLGSDVPFGGADAELLCVDKQAACKALDCSKVSVQYHTCKYTCDACDQLRTAIQKDTALQVRVVQQLTPCIDLHPNCQTWVQLDKCSKEPKSMLELCQASCGFCLPPTVSPLAAGNNTSSSGKSHTSGGAAVAMDGTAMNAVLLDDCQDDINVCPYLAYSGMCSSGSWWIETQCARSCGHCQTGDAGNNSSAGSALQVTVAAATPAPAPLLQKLVSSPKLSGYKLYGSHSAADASLTSEPLQEWPVQDCHDHMDRCPAWAADGECKKNVDYMMIACKLSCGNCKTYTTFKPFRIVQLNNGRTMPAVGFGTAGLGVGTAAAVQYAASVGYRMFDSAESPDWYKEDQVAAGLAAAKLPREQLFLISKIHPRDLGRNATLAAFKRSLAHFNTSYLNLLLLHYPSCSPGTNCVPLPHQSWQESWKALEELAKSGQVHSIGVSNFGLPEMQELLQLAMVKPAILEARSDPFAVNHHLVNVCLENNITFVGYSTLGMQWINSPAAVNPVFSNSVLQGVTQNHPAKTVAQVVLRWALQRGQVVIPRSSSTVHMQENLQLFDFELSDMEMLAINGLDGTWKTGGLPLPVA